ncbi:MAG: guanylate kinase [Patescibacteria group bacterium]|jgi:guanylate kinase
MTPKPLKQKNTGTLFLLVGPSRVGKDTILRSLLRRRSLGLVKLVTMTTRLRRPGEIAGKTYHYVSDDAFQERIAKKQLLEWAPVRNYKYGTPKEPLLTLLQQGHNVIQQIDVRGAAALRARTLRTITIFILPGSLAELKVRLSSNTFTPEQRRVRWTETEQELARQTEFDYRIVNTQGKLGQAVDEVAAIIRSIAQVHS